MTIGPGTLGFYLGHVLELGGVAAPRHPGRAATCAAAARRGRSSATSGATELVAPEQAFLGARVRALMVAAGREGRATEGHTRRVALLAVQVGEELGLPPARCATSRSAACCTTSASSRVAAGDPPQARARSTTTSSRRSAAIPRPACACSTSSAASARACAARRTTTTSGSTAPATRAGSPARDLDLETRILAVCDVYDALVSDRVYRAAWTPERALALLHEETGTAFDRRCVAALERIVTAPSAAPLVARPEPRHAARQALSQNASSCSLDARNAACMRARPPAPASAPARSQSSRAQPASAWNSGSAYVAIHAA